MTITKEMARTTIITKVVMTSTIIRMVTTTMIAKEVVMTTTITKVMTMITKKVMIMITKKVTTMSAKVKLSKIAKMAMTTMPMFGEVVTTLIIIKEIMTATIAKGATAISTRTTTTNTMEIVTERSIKEMTDLSATISVIGKMMDKAREIPIMAE